jgi:tetratricopeptide (TPR) repeat protein
MKSFTPSWWLVPLALTLTSALPVEDVERLVRRGNEAFDREDYTAAVADYARAEDYVTDPGLVAFNKGAALYRLGRFREAELHYLRCREDATGERLARVLFDLGNSILQQARDRDASRLEQAIAHYEECLSHLEAGPELRDDARCNLQLARALLIKAKASKDPSNPEGSDPKDYPNEPRHGKGEYGPDSLDPRSRARAVTDPRGDATREPGSSQQRPPPGMGNLPLLPDQDELAPLSPEDTAEYLRQVAARILRERREHKQQTTSPAAHTFMDW